MNKKEILELQELQSSIEKLNIRLTRLNSGNSSIVFKGLAIVDPDDRFYKDVKRYIKVVLNNELNELMEKRNRYKLIIEP